MRSTGQAIQNLLLALFALTLVLAFTLILLFARPGAADDELVLYAGRSRTLVEPLIQRFEQETGVRVRVRYGHSAELAMSLREAGQRARADLFWAQDAGALGALVHAGLLTPLPDALLADVPEYYRQAQGLWVATSGRARVLAYAPGRVDEAELPASVFDLTDTRYAGRVAWAPTNASFQAFVTAMRRTHGDDATRSWLAAMRDNRPRTYANNTAILEAIAAGEADLGLTNHYYLLRRQAEDPAYPVAQQAFVDGDIGNLLNVAGAARLTTARNVDAADRFIAFLLSDEAQRYFVDETLEYAVRGGSGDDASEAAPRIDLDELEDLQGTLRLLREVGLL